MKPETTIIIHGFTLNRICMYPLALRLRKAGLNVLNWGYASTRHNIRFHAKQLESFIADNCDFNKGVNIVAHSMGCLVARSAMREVLIPNLHRVVMLAPPNAGSPWATLLAPTLGRLCEPVAEMSERPGSFVTMLGEDRVPRCDIGIIAAKFDMLVPLAKTHLCYESDHIVIPATHNSLLISKRASDLTLRFIRTGGFQ